MARYFKYKTPEDVSADAARLGHDLAVSSDMQPLFQPVKIGSKTAGSRLAIQPMEGCDGTPEGLPDELTYRRYVRVGSGGAKLLWGEATAISDEGRMNPRQLWIHEGSLAAIEKMVADCRKAHRDAFDTDSDLVFGLQLTHSGRFGYKKPLLATRDPILDPLTIDKSVKKPIDASYPLLADDDLKRIEDQYIVSARMAEKIGVDFVDIKQCHRYLLSELLGAKNRPGNYGGSFENRTRLVRDVIGRIRSELPNLIIATRMNAYDGIPYRGEGDEFIGHPCPHELPLQVAFGTDPNDPTREILDEPVELARKLREWGVSLINVSGGNPYANPHIVRPAEFPPVDGYHAPEHPLLGVMRQFRLARTIQAAVPDVPVMGSGYSWLQDFAIHAAAANVSRGDVAIAGFGRATLSHPDFAKHLREHGELNRKLICRTFSYCTNLMRSKNHPLGQYPTGCPPFDKETYGPLWKDAESKLPKPQKSS